MNICFVCNEYPPGPHGGIGAFTQILARALVGAGHRVRVIGHYSATYPGNDYEDDQGVQVWRLRGPASHGRWIWARYRLFRWIARWARAGEIDLVEVPDYQGGAAFWPRLPVPVVVRNHSKLYSALSAGRKVPGVHKVLTIMTFRRADSWCSVSGYAADCTYRCFRLSRPAHAVLYCPIELKGVPPLRESSRNRVVFAGTLNENKGVISLIKAWLRVVKRRPDAQLHLFGKDTSYQGISMREYVTTLIPPSIQPTVVFHGHMSREVLYDAFGTARLAVFPSYSETFGIVAFEAMSCGCPTIYTRRPPGPELMEDGIHGLLVDPDDPGDIATAILRLLEDDDLAQRLGEAGRKLVQEKYSVEVIVPQNIRFYEECIARFNADFRKQQGR